MVCLLKALTANCKMYFWAALYSKSECKQQHTGDHNFLTGVWVSILSAVLVVSALLWALEWLSPYSYYNNL